MKSATSGRAELALPTLAIAEVPVAELPVEARLLLWENLQPVKFSIEHDTTRTSENKEGTAQPESDPYTSGVLFAKVRENIIGIFRIIENASKPHCEIVAALV